MSTVRLRSVPPLRSRLPGRPAKLTGSVDIVNELETLLPLCHRWECEQASRKCGVFGPARADGSQALPEVCAFGAEY